MQLTATEVYDWRKFADVHPFPAELQDIHGAQIVAMLANVNRDPAKHPFGFPVSDFMVLGKARKPETEATDEADKFLEAFPEG